MTKKEIITELKNILKELHQDNMEAFCEEHGVEKENYYPFALGYFEAEVAYIACEGSVKEAYELIK